MKGCHFKLLSARMPRSHPDSALAPDAEIPMGISPPQAAPLTSLSSVLSTGSDTYRCAMNLHCTKPQKPQKPPAAHLGGGGPREAMASAAASFTPALCVSDHLGHTQPALNAPCGGETGPTRASHPRCCRLRPLIPSWLPTPSQVTVDLPWYPVQSQGKGKPTPCRLVAMLLPG